MTWVSEKRQIEVGGGWGEGQGDWGGGVQSEQEPGAKNTHSRTYKHNNIQTELLLYKPKYLKLLSVLNVFICQKRINSISIAVLVDVEREQGYLYEW